MLKGVKMCQSEGGRGGGGGMGCVAGQLQASIVQMYFAIAFVYQTRNMIKIVHIRMYLLVTPSATQPLWLNLLRNRG